MTDISALRYALKAKLDERRELLRENSRLSSRNDDLSRENKVQQLALNNAFMGFVLEDCADKIVNHIIDEALRVSEVVAEESAMSGDYEIGISIPSFHIRHHVYRSDVALPRMNDLAAVPRHHTVKKISINRDDKGIWSH